MGCIMLQLFIKCLFFCIFFAAVDGVGLLRPVSTNVTSLIESEALIESRLKALIESNQKPLIQSIPKALIKKAASKSSFSNSQILTDWGKLKEKLNGFRGSFAR